jgi:DNA polymerase-3 subunit gamma/tau
MSYRVLARAYRSKTFDEVVGQEVIATTLKNAIQAGRIHHGYLFTGTRGVGKTSMARILAKALNCLSAEGPTATPCCKCESCLAVAEGQDIDVVEIDAASNTGVDNIRDLRSNATLRPARARFKVYIIDEVHMLSTAAFNALLKTLEEPPGHVKFILATTEIQKVPATIVSRCQRFDFRTIDIPALTAHLQRIAASEGVAAEEDALRRIARLAHGSVRDALSLLDQLLSYDAKKLTAATVDQVLPPPHDETSLALLDRVAERDPGGAMGVLDQGLQSGRTVERFCDHLIEHVRALMLLQTCGGDTDLVDVSASLRPAMVEQSKKFDAPTYVYMITLLEELRRSVKSSGAARALADAAIARLAMTHQFSEIAGLLAKLDGGERRAAHPPQTGDAKKNPSSDAVRPASNPPQAAGQPSAPTSVCAADLERASRDPLVRKVKAAVDGTLLDVRPARQAPATTPTAESEPDEGNQQVLNLGS